MFINFPDFRSVIECTNMAAPGRGETVQKQIQQDWVNREYIEIITISIKKITDFLNSFDLSCRSKLATLNEKLTILERKIDYLEACDEGRDAHMRLVLGPTPRRTLFRWINLQFNAVDHERIKTVGPDRVCAEWILRNGGAIRWVTSPTVISDYNDLPQETLVLKLKAVDATGSSIMHNGFEHFKGCEHVTDLILNECNYLEDEALRELRYLRNSLTFLQVSSCPNLKDEGLLHLGALHRLNRLVLFNLASVKDLGKVVQALKSNLPKCNIQTKLG